jgi:hypothetical protein
MSLVARGHFGRGQIGTSALLDRQLCWQVEELWPRILGQTTNM